VAHLEDLFAVDRPDVIERSKAGLLCGAVWLDFADLRVNFINQILRQLKHKKIGTNLIKKI